MVMMKIRKDFGAREKWGSERWRGVKSWGRFQSVGLELFESG